MFFRHLDPDEAGYFAEFSPGLNVDGDEGDGGSGSGDRHRRLSPGDDGGGRLSSGDTEK